ncbi:MAG: helix-turn-helix transcriptional regulator [Bacteroidota bacterium]
MNTHEFTGRLFRHVRLKRKESYRKFAALLGIHYTTLYRYEQARKGPSRSTLQRLVAVSGAASLEALTREAFALF